jgi:hypothetical protein
LLVLAVLGEVEVHSADDVPGRAEPLQKVLQREARLGALGREGLGRRGPEIA